MARNKTKLNGEINVVPYIDVMLVLLVIFMITAPMLEQGVEVELPSTENNAQVQPQKKEYVYLVSIKDDGKMYSSFDGDTILVTEDELLKSAQKFISKNPNSKAFLRADKEIKYDNVITAMDLLKSSGYQKVGLISKHK